MSTLKMIGAYLVVLLTALTAYLGFTYTFGYAAGTAAHILEPWLWAWAGTASIALAVTLATFCIEISDYLAAAWPLVSADDTAQRNEAVMHANLTAATVHDPIPQKVSIFKLCHPALEVGPSWYVVDVPAGIVVARRYSWADSLETAAHYIRAALTPEVCS